MGTWGPNNFDSDGAHEFFVKHIRDPLLANVDRIIGNSNAIELDEEGESVLMPCIEVLSTFAEVYGGEFVSPDVVQQWRDTYLAVYDRDIDKLNPTPQFKEMRRSIIVHTFARLENASRKE